MYVCEYKPCSQGSIFPTPLREFQIQQGVLLFGHPVLGTAKKKVYYVINIRIWQVARYEVEAIGHGKGQKMLDGRKTQEFYSLYFFYFVKRGCLGSKPR
jgi:hypothetical protein